MIKFNFFLKIVHKHIFFSCFLKVQKVLHNWNDLQNIIFSTKIYNTPASLNYYCFFFKFVRERTGSHHEINSNWSDELVLHKTKLSQNAFRQIAINDLLRKCDIIDDWWYRISANFRFNENMAHRNALLPAFNVKWIKHKIHQSNRVKTYSEQITLTGEYCYYPAKAC